MSIVEFRLHQNSNIKIKVATQIGERPFFVCRCWGVTPHIYSISRSLLQSIAAARSGSAAVAAARG